MGSTVFGYRAPSFSITSESLWALHPEKYLEIFVHGRWVDSPRWQQSYGRDYAYSGQLSLEHPLPESLEPFLCWGQERIDARLDGVLLNWYDGKLGHSIGKHRDSRQGLIPGSPIVTISLGEERTFRLRRYGRKGDGFRDFPARQGRVFVMPYETNLAWTHEVPSFKRWTERRISITLRAFTR